ncbi:Ras family protein [Tritrichomonas foetus]|uniref:Ras family protein n=1 Tax=Tritrichomonas foetus TaxID=1144522 RepID=A0A1J4JXP6_9EUKA|nr:Ras family protein [Tritrichomonas foetus]|eukprot:OHT03763.1 Ras family protein [Tritrichomonas foetus]
MANADPDYKFKICVIGSAGCGKTAMVDQLITHKFQEQTKTTVGVDYRPYQFTINDFIIQLELWDTAGQEQYKAVAKTYFRNATGCVLVFDTTDQASFNELSFWLQQFRQLADPNAMILLVGNKIDLEDKRQIQPDVAEQFAKDNLLVYVETSALTGHNIKETFERVAHGLFDLVKTNKLNVKSAAQANAVPKERVMDLSAEIPNVTGACLC